MRVIGGRWAGAAAAAFAAVGMCVVPPPGLPAQQLGAEIPVLEAIREEGMHRSRVQSLAQVLLDSIGARPTGSPALESAQDWLIGLYAGWGVEARREVYGSWTGWEPGTTHLDLLEPRVRSLEATLLAWSPGTEGPVEGRVIAPPGPGEELEAWRRDARGSFVLVSRPEPSCRPLDRWEELASEDALRAFAKRRHAEIREWTGRVVRLGVTELELPALLARLGAAGFLTLEWSGGYGARRIMGATQRRTPSLSVGCEDYGLLYRLAVNGQSPVVRVDARARQRGEVPVANTIAVLPGTRRPEEYVVLSAHLDSWGGSQAATDNGAGTVVIAEAMRLLSRHYPRPARTILAGHWAGEEQGLNGSRAFALDHPEVVAGLQALFNHDAGTGRVSRINMQGLLDAGDHFHRWLAALPEELTAGIELESPGSAVRMTSDHSSFACAGAPAFSLWTDPWDGRYTWHTNLDTFDKLAFHNLRSAAVLVAMLAYMAAEDPERIDRERRAPPLDPASGRTQRPACPEPIRSWDPGGAEDAP